MATFDLYCGDNKDILESLSKSYAIITDPPYGDDHDTDYTRFSGGADARRHTHARIENDDKPFDPTPWLDFDTVVLWGMNRFSDKLTTGTIFVWDKRTPNGSKGVMSDAEVGWYNKGRGVYVFNHMWDGFNRASERNTAHHPTQKPVALFEWVINRLNLPIDTVIVDPYMGSGPVGVAAIKLGYKFIGCDIVPQYVSIAKQRIEDAARAAAKLPKSIKGSEIDFADSPLFQSV